MKKRETQESGKISKPIFILGAGLSEHRLRRNILHTALGADLWRLEVLIPSKLIYVHPSYREAFKTALRDKNRYNLFCQNIFSRVLLKLAEKSENTTVVLQTVLENFFSFPEDVRDRLLLRLTEKDETAEDVARVVATLENFEELPNEVRCFLIDKLQKKLQHLIASWAKGFPENKIAALSLIWRTRGKINKRFAQNTLQKLSNDKDKKVKSWAIELLSTFIPFQKWRRIDRKHT